MAAALSLFVAACGAQAVEDIPTGTEVVVKLDDGSLVRGRLMNVDPDTLVVEQTSTGKSRSIERTMVVDVEQPGIAEDRSLGERIFSRESAYDDLAVPAGTVIPVELETSIASDASKVEDVVRAVLRVPLAIEGDEVLPAGSQLVGHVTSAVPSGKVKGRAHLSFMFDEIRARSTTYEVSTRPVAITAPGTKKDDAAKIGIGAGVGSIIGGIAGGGDGAAIGAAVGGGAGTAVVLSTSGDEVRVVSGRELRIELTRPFTVRIPRNED